MGSTERFFAAIEAGDADLVRSMVAADPSLAPLSSNVDATPGTIGAPDRFFDVDAIQATVVHNPAQNLRSTVKTFVPHGTTVSPMAMGPCDPLVLRAKAGDVIQINLTNALPAGSGRVGLHAGLVSAGPAGQGITVGLGPEQTADVGETIRYVFVADRELGVVDLVSLAHPQDAEEGLYGALVIEPQNATFTPVIGPHATVTTGGRTAREHVLLLHSEDGQFESSTMDYLPDVQGRVLVNFGTEPLDHGATVPGPLGKMRATGLDTCSVETGCAGHTIRVRNPADPIATAIPVLATPTLDAVRGRWAIGANSTCAAMTVALVFSVTGRGPGGTGDGRYEPPSIRSPNPNVIASVPSVTMNAGSRIPVTSPPFKAPKAPPTSIPTAISQ